MIVDVPTGSVEVVKVAEPLLNVPVPSAVFPFMNETVFPIPAAICNGCRSNLFLGNSPQDLDYALHVSTKVSKQDIEALRELLGRFEHVCRDADGDIDPADKKRLVRVERLMVKLVADKAAIRRLPSA